MCPRSGTSPWGKCKKKGTCSNQSLETAVELVYYPFVIFLFVPSSNKAHVVEFSQHACGTDLSENMRLRSALVMYVEVTGSRAME